MLKRMPVRFVSQQVSKYLANSQIRIITETYSLGNIPTEKTQVVIDSIKMGIRC